MMVTRSRRGKKGTHLDAIPILKSSLKHTKHRVGLQVHNQIRTSCKDPISTLPQPSCLRCLCHAERLCLKCMPRASAGHSLVSKVADSVDTVLPDESGRFMGEGVEEESF
jgi:hypothetical protein